MRGRTIEVIVDAEMVIQKGWEQYDSVLLHASGDLRTVGPTADLLPVRRTQCRLLGLMINTLAVAI